MIISSVRHLFEIKLYACSRFTTFGDEEKLNDYSLHLPAFDPQMDDWPTYAERLKHYFIANDVLDPAKKQSILLTVCGASAFKLLSSLTNRALNTTSYENLVHLLKDHYDPKPSAIVQRYRCNTRSRDCRRIDR